MEIDFLGLNSPTCNSDQHIPNNPYLDAGGGVEISLSLGTSSSLNVSKKKKWEFAACEKTASASCSGSTVCSLPSYSQEQEKTEQLILVAPPAFRHSATAGELIFDVQDNIRNVSQLSSTEPPASLTMLLYPNLLSQQQKADQNKVSIISGNGGRDGIPTVAMARRASLARFLEKRLHRMNQARASHFMGRSNNSDEYCQTKLRSSNR